MNKKRVLAKILSGSRNIRFAELTALVEALGFTLSRTSGSHHIYQHPQAAAPINLQNVNGQAKPYQARQVVEIMERSGLTLSASAPDDEEPSAGEGNNVHD